jgi:hypothetical protein
MLQRVSKSRRNFDRKADGISTEIRQLRSAGQGAAANATNLKLRVGERLSLRARSRSARWGNGPLAFNPPANNHKFGPAASQFSQVAAQMGGELFRLLLSDSDCNLERHLG